MRCIACTARDGHTAAVARGPRGSSSERKGRQCDDSPSERERQTAWNPRLGDPRRRRRRSLCCLRRASLEEHGSTLEQTDNPVGFHCHASIIRRRIIVHHSSLKFSPANNETRRSHSQFPQPSGAEFSGDHFLASLPSCCCKVRARRRCDVGEKRGLHATNPPPGQFSVAVAALLTLAVGSLKTLAKH